MFAIGVALLPAIDEALIAGVPVSWLLLGLGVYPLAITVAALYVRARPGTRPLPLARGGRVNPAIGYAAIATVAIVSVLIGVYGLRISRTTSDFYVASRTVQPWWNASAIGGEYLSAASFLGIAGLILLTGASALWFPIGYTGGLPHAAAVRRGAAAPLGRRTRSPTSPRRDSSRPPCGA